MDTGQIIAACLGTAGIGGLLGAVGALIAVNRKSRAEEYKTISETDRDTAAVAMRRRNDEESAALKRALTAHDAIVADWQKLVEEVRANNSKAEEHCAELRIKIDVLVEQRLKCQEDLAAAKTQIHELQEQATENRNKVRELMARVQALEGGI